VKYWLRIPEMTVATDGTPGVGVDGNLLPWDADYSKYAGNPRAALSYAKVLRMAREEGVPLTTRAWTRARTGCLPRASRTSS